MTTVDTASVDSAPGPGQAAEANCRPGSSADSAPGPGQAAETNCRPGSYVVAAGRAPFPPLAEGAAPFTAPGGSQTPDVVADAVAGTLRAAVANRGDITVAERRADSIVLAAREAMADLLGAVPGGIVFGRSMTALTYDFARALAKRWRPGD